MPRVAYEGRAKRIVFAEETSGKARGEEFYEGLSTPDLAKVTALFRMLGEQGQIRNREKFRHEEDGIWCFKSFQIRLLCFLDGRDVVITHGFVKKDNKMPKTELGRAKRIRQEHKGRSGR